MEVEAREIAARLIAIGSALSLVQTSTTSLPLNERRATSRATTSKSVPATASPSGPARFRRPRPAVAERCRHRSLRVRVAAVPSAADAGGGGGGGDDGPRRRRAVRRPAQRQHVDVGGGGVRCGARRVKRCLAVAANDEVRVEAAAASAEPRIRRGRKSVRFAGIARRTPGIGKTDTLRPSTASGSACGGRRTAGASRAAGCASSASRRRRRGAPPTTSSGRRTRVETAYTERPFFNGERETTTNVRSQRARQRSAFGRCTVSTSSPPCGTARYEQTPHCGADGTPRHHRDGERRGLGRGLPRPSRRARRSRRKPQSRRHG